MLNATDGGEKRYRFYYSAKKEYFKEGEKFSLKE